MKHKTITLAAVAALAGCAATPAELSLYSVSQEMNQVKVKYVYNWAANTQPDFAHAAAIANDSCRQLGHSSIERLKDEVPYYPPGGIKTVFIVYQCK